MRFKSECPKCSKRNAKDQDIDGFPCALERVKVWESRIELCNLRQQCLIVSCEINKELLSLFNDIDRIVASEGLLN